MKKDCGDVPETDVENEDDSGAIAESVLADAGGAVPFKSEGEVVGADEADCDRPFAWPLLEFPN